MKHEIDWVAARAFLQERYAAPTEIAGAPSSHPAWGPPARLAEQALHEAVAEVTSVLTPRQLLVAERIMAMNLEQPGLPTIHRLLFAMSEFGWLLTRDQAAGLSRSTRDLLDDAAERFPDEAAA